VFYVILGLIAGTISGLIGIGGGVFIIPVLVYFFKFSQHQAQGTSLALLVLPIGILGAWTYFQKGYVNLSVVLLMAIGFFVGGLLGAKIAVLIPDQILKKVFGISLLIISLKMIFFS